MKEGTGGTGCRLQHGWDEVSGQCYRVAHSNTSSAVAGRKDGTSKALPILTGLGERVWSDVGIVHVESMIIVETQLRPGLNGKQPSIKVVNRLRKKDMKNWLKKRPSIIQSLQWEPSRSYVISVHDLAPYRSDYTVTREHMRCHDGIVGYNGAMPCAVRWKSWENKSTAFVLSLVSERQNEDRRRD